MNETSQQKIEKHLALLAEARQNVSNARARLESERDDVLTDAQRAEIRTIEKYHAATISALAEAADKLEQNVKKMVLGLGESVSNQDHLIMAVYSKGRAKWNDDALSGYAAAHPEVMAFRSVGDPSVSIRNMKG